MANPKSLKPSTVERNRRLAESGERELDSLGRRKSGPNTVNYEEEEQVWSDPEDRSITKLVWRRVPLEDRRCRATIKNKLSPWLGNRCCQNAIHGGVVCVFHGGRLPNVRKAAQRRLALAAVPAADRLIYMALKKRKMSDSDRLKAILAILDRAGVEGRSTIEIEVKPWQEALQTLFTRFEGDGTSPQFVLPIADGADEDEEDQEFADNNWDDDE